MRLHHVVSSALIALSLTACPSDDESTCPPDDGVMDDVLLEPAECPDDLPEMHLGMTALSDGGSFRGELLEADKIPLGWYHNDWQVRFTGPNGEPLGPVEIIKAEPFMPVHGHNGGQPPVVEPIGTAGSNEFDVMAINITMNGPWEVRFDIKVGDVMERVTFNVCNSQPKPVSPSTCE